MVLLLLCYAYEICPACEPVSLAPGTPETYGGVPVHCELSLSRHPSSEVYRDSVLLGLVAV